MTKTFLWIICSNKDFGWTNSMEQASGANFKLGIFLLYPHAKSSIHVWVKKYQMTFAIQTCQKFVISPQNISWIRQIWPQNELSIFQYRKLAESFFRPNSGTIWNVIWICYSLSRERGFRYSPQCRPNIEMNKKNSVVWVEENKSNVWLCPAA